MIESFEKDFFKGAQLEHIEFDLLNDQWEALKAEFSENEWPVEEGLRYILAAGLRVIQNENTLDDNKIDKLDPLIEIKKLQSERMRLDGRYAVMKYRTYQFMQAVQVLQWKLNAAKTEMEGLKQLIQKLRHQLENNGQA